MGVRWRGVRLAVPAWVEVMRMKNSGSLAACSRDAGLKAPPGELAALGAHPGSTTGR